MSKTIQIADRTLCRENGAFSFKEKTEIARQLERLRVDAVELPEIVNPRADILLIRTMASFVKKTVLSVAVGSDADSLKNALAALSSAARPRIRMEVPVSPVGMEYLAHRKPQKMLEWITDCVQTAKKTVADVEFCALDATRAEPEFLAEAIRAAADAGATSVTICDSAAETLPDEFAQFVASVCENTTVPVGVLCNNRTGLAGAEALMAVRRGAIAVKTDLDGSAVPLDTFAEILRACGARYGLEARIGMTELQRTAKQIRRISQSAQESATLPEVNDDLILNEKDSLQDVIAAVTRLGYDLSDEDQKKVYEEFCRTAAKKQVGARELDAIVANTAMQVPQTYQLVNYVVNSGNIITTSAQITLVKDGKQLSGISMGDGPVASAFNAIEQIVGHHYELDDFRIQSVTEGREALGSALVRLRSNGRLYAGNGISTDIIGAAIRAYLSALNKMIYEEAEA